MESSNRKLYLAEEQKKKTIYDYLEDYLIEKYDIRFNEIAQEFQIRLKGQGKWEEFEMNSLLIELARSNIEVTPTKLEIFLKSYMIPRYNPIQSYFEELPKWNGNDHISDLASYLPLREPKAFLYHFRKWLVRSVKCAMEDAYFNKQCLVLVHAAQNSGKSTWCRFLCPPKLSNYIAEDLSNDKDARIQLTRNFLINLDELSVLARKETNALKAYFSKTIINERLPYDRKNTSLHRCCSFIGSTNRTTFLNDETGSVRWLCFELLGKIDFNYSRKIDINQVWAQAFMLAYMDIDFSPELTPKDIAENELRNNSYRQATMEEELLNKFYTPSQKEEDFYTTTDILSKLQHVNNRLNVVNMGRALAAQGYERVKDKKRRIYGYLAKPSFKYSPLENI
ncbi:virulence-associated E family protein [Zunongwangia sp. SCSIO 43204]|uniref:virulence-associated E family protein n=2 Tax=Zunongwangia sp. SCSIO 43204 TaxID=2779359 RepID=UPI001CA81806|nr:virulence-associated E family protein [Zunongwangia sp. SCSIO 43204]UAB82841.1 virulence-associated E family protein [Zunongwangia sp. SCSIO 43204]